MLTRSSERIFNSTAILVVLEADDIPCSCNYNIRIVMSNLYSYATHLQLRQNSYAKTVTPLQLMPQQLIGYASPWYSVTVTIEPILIHSLIDTILLMP